MAGNCLNGNGGRSLRVLGEKEAGCVHYDRKWAAWMENSGVLERGC